MNKDNKIARYEGLIEQQKEIVNKLKETRDGLDEDIDKARSQLIDYEVELRTLKEDIILKNLKTGTCYHISYKDKKSSFSWEELKESIVFIDKATKNSIIMRRVLRASTKHESKFNDYKHDCIDMYKHILTDSEWITDFKNDLLKDDAEIIQKEDAENLVRKWMGL